MITFLNFIVETCILSCTKTICIFKSTIQINVKYIESLEYDYHIFAFIQPTRLRTKVIDCVINVSKGPLLGP